MKEFLKNQAGVAFIVVILVIVIASAGGGATFLAVRMVVSGDGNFLEPFEELGWIDPKSDSEDKEEETEKEETKKETSNEKEDSSSSDSKYLVDTSRLSSEAKKDDVTHYYADCSDFLLDSMGSDTDDELYDLYKTMKAEVDVYVSDDEVVELVLAFDISEFCEKAFDEYKEEMGSELQDVSSSKELEKMLLTALETTFTPDSDDAEYKTYTDNGKFQLYATDKGIESLYSYYGFDDEEPTYQEFLEEIEDELETSFKVVD